jgi:hypothetical protein
MAPHRHCRCRSKPLNTLDSLSLRAADPGRLVVLDLNDFLSSKFPDAEPLIRLQGTDVPVFTSSPINQIFAWRGTGKTMLSLAFAGAMSHGTEFLRWRATRKIKVLYQQVQVHCSRRPSGAPSDRIPSTKPRARVFVRLLVTWARALFAFLHLFFITAVGAGRYSRLATSAPILYKLLQFTDPHFCFLNFQSKLSGLFIITNESCRVYQWIPKFLQPEWIRPFLSSETVSSVFTIHQDISLVAWELEREHCLRQSKC